MTLSLLSILLGLAAAGPGLYALLQPDDTRAVLKRFPRSILPGYALVTLATVWFLYYLKLENIADFTAYKPYMFAGFAALGVGTCVYLKDFLAIRGLALVMMLLAKLTVDSARWADTSWRLVLVTLAYVWVWFGMWWTISPWRCRDLIDWATANEGRFKALAGVRVGLGLLLVALGLTVFRG